VGRTAKHRPLYTICRYIPGLWCWCQSRMACADPIRLALSAIAAPSTVSKRHHDIFFSECVQGTNQKKTGTMSATLVLATHYSPA
jgi:hypothetical protein